MNSGTTHNQIDEYSKKRTAEISDATSSSIEKVVADTAAQQQQLLAELERALNDRQEAILLKARQDIDFVQNVANQEKLAVFKEAQAKSSLHMDQITGEVAELAAEDAQRRLQSTTQTVRFSSGFI